MEQIGWLADWLMFSEKKKVDRHWRIDLPKSWFIDHFIGVLCYSIVDILFEQCYFCRTNWQLHMIAWHHRTLVSESWGDFTSLYIKSCSYSMRYIDYHRLSTCIMIRASLLVYLYMDELFYQWWYLIIVSDRHGASFFCLRSVVSGVSAQCQQPNSRQNTCFWGHLPYPERCDACKNGPSMC